MTKTQKKKANKKMTLGEFQAWIEGIQMLQGDDWCPDASQWSMIVERIYNITPDVVEKIIEKQAPPTPRPPQPMPQFQQPAAPPPPPMQAPHSSLGGGAPTPRPPQPMNKPTQQLPINTPNVDENGVEQGEYSSPFV